MVIAGAQRELSLSLPLSHSFSFPLRPRSPRCVCSALRFRLFLAVTASPSLVLFRKKKEEDLGQFLSHKPADRAAPIKNASLRMAIGPQRASGVMPNRSSLSLYPSRPALRRWRLFPTRVLQFSSRLPRALSCASLSLSLIPTFFSTRGKNARRPSIGRGDR